jgi:hypothetical protein
MFLRRGGRRFCSSTPARRGKSAEDQEHSAVIVIAESQERRLFKLTDFSQPARRFFYEPLRRALYSLFLGTGPHAPWKAILTPLAVLLDHALLFEAAKDRGDGASRSGALCRFIDMLN